MIDTYEHNNESRLLEITKPFFSEDSPSHQLIRGNLPTNRDMMSEIIRQTDLLISSGHLRGTAIAQLLSIKLTAIQNISQSREQELLTCLRQSCSLIEQLLTDNRNPALEQNIRHFMLELQLLEMPKSL